MVPDAGSDGLGRLTGLTDQSGSTAYQYDARGNLIQKTVTIGGHAFTVSYAYDADDNLTGLTYPDGTQVTYNRDAAERITSVQSSSSGTVVSGITYEPFGPVTGLTYGNGLAETRGYDQDYRLTSLTDPNIQSWTLGHNADDDITGITDNLTSANSQSFNYDSLNRLTNAQGSYGSLGYSYDADGNRLQQTLNSTHTAYGYATTSNQLLSAGSANEQYDAAGNLLNDSIHSYSYNDAGRLTGYDANLNVYLYNGLGQRVQKPSPVIPGDANGDGVINQLDLLALQQALKGQIPITPGMDCNQDGVVDNKDKSCIAQQIGNYKNQGKGNGSGTGNGTSGSAGSTATASSLYLYFVYDEAGHLLGEYDQNSNLIAEHIWLNNRPIAVITSAGLYYVQTDQLGTPRAITNASEQLVWEWSSNPFGNGHPNTNPSGIGLFSYNLRFPGQYYDAETGHNYNYFRDYDPSIGRYIESDPAGLVGGINTYAYSGNNPITNFDPLGEYCTSSGGWTFCAYPGGPAFELPTPSNFPAYLGPNGFTNSLLYHSYEVSVSTDCSDAQMLQALINSPAPGNSISPASASGTPNVAQAFGINNPILSYVTTDLNNGNPIVVNVTNSANGFSPGYVAREVSNGVVQNYGEGFSLVQSPLVFSHLVNFLVDQYVWGHQTNNAAKKCSCSQ